MSPSKKTDKPRRSRCSHATDRHGTAPSMPNAPPAAASLALEWDELGQKLAAFGAHRVALALHAARTVVLGGIGVSTDEEDAIARWFAGIVDEAIDRGDEHAAGAIWFLLMGDWQRASDHHRLARCPAIAAMLRSPGELGFVAALRAAAPSYARTVIAGAGPDEIATLRAIVRADDAALDEWRPWGVSLVDDHPASEDLENARQILTSRHLTNRKACNGFSRWANGMASAVAEHAVPGVYRLGAIAWFAKVALVGEERAS
jgi:hypothetical protein